MTQDALRVLLPVRNRLVAGLVFTREWLRSPRAMGMVCPSGAALAQTMADGVPLTAAEALAVGLPAASSPTGEPPFPSDLVVELGAGTGTVTTALLRRGVSPRRLVVVERSASMVDLLRQRFPGLRVIHGDAARLSVLLSPLLPPDGRIGCVVSSLPLVSLPDEVRFAVLGELRKVLGDQGRLIQYTYSWGRRFILCREGFRCTSSRRVWRNLPPARVMQFMAPPVPPHHD